MWIHSQRGHCFETCPSTFEFLHNYLAYASYIEPLLTNALLNAFCLWIPSMLSWTIYHINPFPNNISVVNHYTLNTIPLFGCKLSTVSISLLAVIRKTYKTVPAGSGKDP